MLCLHRRYNDNYLPLIHLAEIIRDAIIWPRYLPGSSVLADLWSATSASAVVPLLHQFHLRPVREYEAASPEAFPTDLYNARSL